MILEMYRAIVFVLLLAVGHVEAKPYCWLGITVESVRFNGLSLVAQLELEELLSEAGGAKDDACLSGAMVRQSLIRHPFVEDVQLNWKLAERSLEVNVIETIPWLVAEVSGTNWLLSRRGTLMKPLSEVRSGGLVLRAAELPRVTGLSAKQNSDGRFRQAVGQLKQLRAAGGLPFRAEAFELLDDGSIRVSPFDFRSAPELVLFARNGAEAQRTLHRLSLVLNDIARREEKPNNIDLRFGNQVVVGYDEAEDRGITRVP